MAKKMTPENAATQWLVLKEQIRAIEKKLDTLKTVLEPALREAKEKTFEFHGWRFSLVEFEKENFSLSKAKGKIDGRILAPYVTVSQVVQIRTSFQGGN